MAAGKIIQGVRWLQDEAGKLVGYRNPVTDQDEAASLVSGDGTIRAVAARPGLPFRWHATNKSSNSKFLVYARDNLSSIKLLFANYCVAVTAVGAADGAEFGFGDAEIRCGIEYPSGVFTAVTFGGSVLGLAPSGGTLESDFVTVAIPDGAQFTVWTSYKNMTGVGMPYRQNGISGVDVAQFSTGTALADISMGGAITQTQAGSYYGPAAIVGRSKRPAVALLGDSRIEGFADTGMLAPGAIGPVQRATWADVADISMGQRSDRLTWWLANSTERRKLLQYVTHVWCNFGINDLDAGGRTVAQLIADYTALATVVGKPMVALTLPPKTTSSDNFSTAGNQTVPAVGAKITDMNAALLGRSVPGVSRVADVARVVQDPSEPTKWKTNGSANAYTTDGLHETPLAYEEMSAAVDLARLLVTAPS